jgi:hypothetical protein
MIRAPDSGVSPAQQVEFRAKLADICAAKGREHAESTLTEVVTLGAQNPTRAIERFIRQRREAAVAAVLLMLPDADRTKRQVMRGLTFEAFDNHIRELVGELRREVNNGHL